MPNKCFAQNLFFFIALGLLATACMPVQKTSTIGLTPSTVTKEAKPTAFSTNTSIPSSTLAEPTQTPTPTKKPSSSPTITVTATEAYHPPTILMESQYLVINDLDGNLILVEVNSGRWRTLDLNWIGRPYHIIKITDNGCAIYIEMVDKSIIKVDSTGDNPEIILPEGWYPADEIPLNISLSFSKEWAAYIVGRGYQGYSGFEKQEIHLFEIETSQKVLLSENDGVWDFEWSSNDLAIAFSDFDVNGINQVYIATGPDWQKKQVSNFADPGQRIENIQWSPQGDRLAFTREDVAQKSITVSILQPNGKIPDLNIGPFFSSFTGPWWQGENTIGFIAYQPGHTQPEERSIYFIDTTTGKINDILEVEKVDEVGIYSAAVLSNTNAGFFSSLAFYYYDLSRKSVTRAFTNIFDTKEWLVSPFDFEGEESCLP